MELQSGSLLRIKKPSGRGVTFAIQYKNPGCGWATYRSEAVDTINLRLRGGQLTNEQAFDRIRLIVDDLYKQRDRHTPRAVMASTNARTLDRYLASKYTPAKLARLAPRSYESQVYYLKQALTYLGNTPIDTEINILQETIDRALQHDRRKHKRMVSVLNSILLWMGRKDRLLPFPEERWEISQVGPAEIGGLLRELRPEILKVAAAVAWWTGVRLGELCAIQAKDVASQHLLVHSQIDDDLNRRRTKTRKSRRVFLEPEARQWLETWLQFPEQDRVRFRQTRPSAVVKEAAQRVLGKKDITFHSLRHSRAVYLIGKGLPIEIVAQNLGNSPLVCEKHYYGHILSSQGSDLMERLLVSHHPA